MAKSELMNQPAGPRKGVRLPPGMRRFVVAQVALVAATLSIVASPAEAGDADNNGRDELAIGAPSEDVSGYTDSGALWIMEGTLLGLANAFIISEGTTGAAGTLEADDEFAEALSWGDFNGDGRDDLAVGIPDEDIGSMANAGAVTVFPGSSNGVTTAGSAQWTLSSSGVVGSPAVSDGWGHAIATGDFNGDSYDDLAVGAGTRDVGAVQGGGTVTVLYGSSSGLQGTGSTEWSEDASGVAGTAENFDAFGSALAGGDFDGDGRVDLAVGARESVGSIGNAGAVTVLMGSASGITGTGSVQWHQDTAGVPGVNETADNWGTDAIAAGDFDGNGRDDLAVGAQRDEVGTIDAAGAVTLLKGSATGLTATGSSLWHEDTAGVAGEAEEQDNFGSSLASGDFDGNGRDDLAIGAPGETIAESQFAGAVVVLKGSASDGLTATGSVEWHANTTGIPGSPGYRDAFGSSVAAGDFNGDGEDDLAIGIPGDSTGAASSGSIVVLRGTSSGLNNAGAVEIYQGSGAPGVSETLDGFGTTLN